MNPPSQGPAAAIGCVTRWDLLPGSSVWIGSRGQLCTYKGNGLADGGGAPSLGAETPAPDPGSMIAAP